jgi:hypothetical protein
MIHLALLTCLYFLPTIIASHRGHGITGILLLNFFLGWTGIGWLALLLWALLSRPDCYCFAAPPYYPYGYWRR